MRQESQNHTSVTTRTIIKTLQRQCCMANQSIVLRSKGHKVEIRPFLHLHTQCKRDDSKLQLLQNEAAF